ncbi:MAG TPA: VWA domain-containing protein, partial [Thermoanaerobaculia bacterium]|nr:VWA domain-containing protein [Thermoanaerobaculia bacterium]
MHVGLPSRHVLAILLLSTLASVTPARAADVPARIPGVRAAVDVTVMDLDVIATGKDGRNVPDLTRAEISVTVDGKHLPLDYFARVEAGQLHGPDLATASPDFILETTAAGPDRYVPRQFLVFFDDEHLLPSDRKRVLEGLRDFVTRLSPSDSMAILSYNVSSHVITPFTNSKESLLEGLSRLEKIAPRGLFWDSQYRQDLGLARRQRRRSSADAIIRSYSEQIRSREKGTLDELRRAFAALAARSGKRVAFWVSSGIELRPGQTLAQALSTNSLSQFDYTLAEEYQAAVAEANRSGITVHAFDARGLATDVDASEAEAPVVSPFLADANRREALAGLAEETGGIFVVNHNTFSRSLERIYQESASYYSIGVTLTALDPKKTDHSVRVTTTRPGVTLRTRRGYGAKTADASAGDRMELALVTPDASGEFPVSLAIGPPKKGGGIGRRISPFKVSVPLSAFNFLDDSGRKKAVVDIALAAVEDNGARSNAVPDRKTILVDAAALAKAGEEPFVYEGEVKSRKGNMRFVATVRDVSTNRIGIGSASVR